MRTVTLKEAERDLQRLVTKVVDDSDPAIVVTESGRQAVLMSLDDFNAWSETHYLLANPANADHLRRSIAQANAGEAEERNLLET